MTVTSSTLNGNSAVSGGGIKNNGTVTLINTTVSGNTTKTHVGGGIENGNGSTLILKSTTVSGNNSKLRGGGIYNESGGAVNLTNTIVAGNTATQSGPDCTGSQSSQGHNLIGTTSGCSFSATISDQTAVNDPQLGPLADNGGPTFTHALLPGSPAIDAGNPAAPGSGGNACPTTDQRGVSRPLGPRCDIGAFEGVRVPATITVTKTGDTDTTCIATDCSPREAIKAAQSGDKIVLSPGIYTLTLGRALSIAKSLTLEGAGSGHAIIQAAVSSADATSRVFEIGGNVNISGVTIRHGNAGHSNDGGA